MKRQVEMFEVSFDFTMLLFADQADAAAAVSALSRGAYMSAASNPHNPQARIDLYPIEPKMRRVFIPVSGSACAGAFGKRLKPARVEAPRLTAGAVRDDGREAAIRLSCPQAPQSDPPRRTAGSPDP